MQTLTYGLKLPETGDKGSVFFPALEENIIQLDSHIHNGTDSPFLPPSSMNWTQQTLLAANWEDLTNGNYRQLASIPGSINYDTRQIFFRNQATGLYYPGLTVERASDSSFYVYINDNTVTLTVIYV